jgi:S1-C subfamily serine protease
MSMKGNPGRARRAGATLVVLLAAGVSDMAVRLAAEDALQRVERQIHQQRAQGQSDSQRPDEQAEEALAEPGYWGLLADEGTDAGHGVRIREVLPGGPAAQAGLQVDDVIVAVGSTPVRTMKHLAEVVDRSPPGTRLVLTILRPLPGVGTQTRHVSITLGRRPPPGERPFGQFGALRAEPTGEIVWHAVLGAATRWQADARTGNAGGQGAAVVVEVMERSPAAGAGLAAGDAVVALDGVLLADHDDLRRRLASRSGQRVELAYQRHGQLHRVVLALADDRPRPMPPPRILGPADAPEVGGAGPGAPPTPAQRLEALERRVQQLEARVQQLEAELAKQRGQ